MKGRAALAGMLFVLASACNRAPTADPSKPEAFARQTSLQPAPGGRLQRVSLPAAMLAAVRRPDLGDIRVFDARGKVVPLALLETSRPRGPRRSVDLPVYPVIGSGDDLRNADLSVRIEGNGVTRAVVVDQSSASADQDLPPAAALLDTRGVREPIDAISLRADLPAGRPITLTLLTSTNLKDWEPLAQKVLFRPVNRAAPLGGAEVMLNGARLRDRFVGISWGGADGVTLKGASAVIATVAAPERTGIPTQPLTLADPHQALFDVPPMGLLAAIRVTPLRADGVVPVRLFGRSVGKDRWTLLAAGTLQPDRGKSTLELVGAPMTSYRLEADRRTAGFSAAPRLELLFEPVDLLVALSGTAPYRLAVGQAKAAPNYLSLAEIAPQGDTLDLAKLPMATLAAASEPPPIIALQPGEPDGALNPRKLLLWAALLLGTLVLAVAAFRLMRANASLR